MRYSLTVSAMILAMGVVSCGQQDDEDKTNPPIENPQSGDLETGNFLISLSNLEALSGSHYEGWLIDNGAHSSGRFNINADGLVQAVDASGQFKGAPMDTESAVFSVSEALEDASTFVLTIEPDGDSDEGPSAVHLVAGDFQEGSTIATIDHAAAIGVDFSTVAGSFILATPSNGPETNNQGIWFLDASDESVGAQPSLELPKMNNGWVYEGWVVNTSADAPVAVSTGRFASPSTADSDGAGGALAGPNSTPDFPGQDFINPAKILNTGDYSVVISIEPDPDSDVAPFAIKLLAAPIEVNQPVASSVSLNKLELALPQIQASFR